jgi:transcriptional regulator with XRE-family HTH domain
MKSKSDLKNINNRLKFFITTHFGGSVRQFALSLDKVDPGVLSNIVGGRLNKPSSDLLVKLKKKYPELNLDWLISGEGEMINISNDEKLVKTQNKMETQEKRSLALTLPKDKEALNKLEKDIMSPIIKRIKMLRLREGYTYEDISPKLGMSLTGYASIEQEKVFFSIPKLIYLKKLFNTTYDYIIEGVERPQVQVSPDRKLLEEQAKEIIHLKKLVESLEKQVSLHEQLSGKK